MPWYQLLVYVIWMGSEVMLGRLRRSGQGTSSTTDKSTLRLIWLTLMPSVALAVFLSVRTYCRLYEPDIFRILGLLLMLAGIILRLMVVRSLGAAFTVDVAIVPGHALRQTGFFRLVRHPSYAFSLLTFFGFGLVLNNGWSMIMLMVPVFLVFRQRMKVEEAALTVHFGEAYRAYMARTKRLIPFVY
jgi:protein-S-isoprenylcysteine O-methyltransferase Ste14